jgi:DNA-binding transcriptional LysR family regulator
MDLQELRYAVTLADELHFGKAARRHFISEQPFGRHIRRLEREVGCRLFERTSRRVSLTRAGERLVADARRILAAVDGLADLARQENRGTEGQVTVGVLGFGLAERWEVLLELVSSQVPDLEVRYRELDLVSQHEVVRLGYVDIGIVQDVGPVDGLVFDHVLTMPRVAVVPTRSPYADAGCLTASEAEEASWISMAEGNPGMRAWAGPAAQARGPGTGVCSPAAIPAAVATTGRLGLHAEGAARYYPRPDVRFIPTEGPPCEIVLAAREGDRRPLVTAFQRAIRLVKTITSADQS